MMDLTRLWIPLAALCIVAAAIIAPGSPGQAAPANPGRAENPLILRVTVSLDGTIRISRNETESPRSNAHPVPADQVPLSGGIVVPASWKDFALIGLRIEGASPETRGVSEEVALERGSACRYSFRGSSLRSGRYRLRLMDPPSSSEVVISEAPVPITWEIPERVTVEVQVVDGDGEPVPGAEVWSSCRRNAHGRKPIREHRLPVPEDRSDLVTVDPATGVARLTVAPWEALIKVHAAGYVRARCKLALGDATQLEHRVVLKKAGYLVAQLRNWDPWGDATVLSIRTGEEAQGPSYRALAFRNMVRFTLEPGCYIVVATDPAIDHPVTSQPVEIRVGETAQVALEYPTGTSPPQLIAETRGRLLHQHVQDLLDDYGIPDMVHLPPSRIATNDQGHPIAVMVRGSFKGKQRYAFGDLMRFICDLEHRRRGIRVAMMDFGAKDPAPGSYWRPLEIEAVHAWSLSDAPDATRERGSRKPCPRLTTVMEGYSQALQNLREEGLMIHDGITHLRVEIGPTSHIRWSMYVERECDLPRLRAAFADWPGFQDLTLGERKREGDVLLMEDLLLTWSP